MADIRFVNDLESMLIYFQDKLNWRIDLDSFDMEDITYNFEAADVHLKDEEFIKIKSLCQIRPIVDDQPWGIFAIEFDSKRFEVTALRKVLSGLIPRRRNADHAMWDKKNILFLCFWGETDNRTIGIAFFEDKEGGLPQIKIVYCNPKVEDFTQLERFETKLMKLSWPENPTDHKAWHKQWSDVFSMVYHQVIRDSATLTTELAAVAKRIQRRILAILQVETENGYVHLLYGKFKETLIHDMTEIQFADMYAQTVAYGLFSARCMDTDEDFDPRKAMEYIPNTNPFLKRLLKECLAQDNHKLSFDELELCEVVELLRNIDPNSIMDDFNRQTGGGKEDPVIYFYEGFLNAYESEQKKRRGVYYTPQPIVNFIVRAVDDILKSDFGMEDGLAATDTTKITIKRDSKRKVGGMYKQIEDIEEVPAIQILDPATGTGTFIRQAILQIWDNFKVKHREKSESEVKRLWNEYVPKHLLRRLNGFELMMAPYAVAHMKLAMVLKDTGYDFSGDDRIKVFLTNSLEEAGSTEAQIKIWEDPLAAESIEANIEKKNTGLNIVIGNPPYSVSSANRGDWIQDLLYLYKEGLEERKLNLDDDYIKFIRLGHYFTCRNNRGILAYISNNSFINGVTHRKMRKELMASFGTIYVINLHGDSNRQEVSPDGSKDENVFDIQQGVSINIFVRDLFGDTCGQVFYTDIYGTRYSKNALLACSRIQNIKWRKATPKEPYFFFDVKDYSQYRVYEKGFSVAELFVNKNTGIQTKRDNTVLSFSKEEVDTVVSDFLTLDEESIRLKYGLPEDGRDWTIALAKADLQKNSSMIVQCLYRPFDIRFTAYTGKTKGFIGYPRSSTMNHMLYQNNYALLLGRQNKSSTIDSFLVTNLISEMKCAERTIQSYHLPLFIYEQTFDGIKCRPNLNEGIIIQICDSLKLNFTSKNEYSDMQCFTPLDLFDYIYSILYSPCYRKTFKEFLKIDFPRIPYPTNKETFWKLVALGGELRGVHLLESSVFDDIDADLPIKSRSAVSKVAYHNEKVYINATEQFDDVPKVAWELYIGGYQPAQKWLKDRKGHVLSAEDIKHYRKIIRALVETDRIMKEIDEVYVF